MPENITGQSLEHEATHPYTGGHWVNYSVLGTPITLILYEYNPNLNPLSRTAGSQQFPDLEYETGVIYTPNPITDPGLAGTLYEIKGKMKDTVNGEEGVYTISDEIDKYLTTMKVFYTQNGVPVTDPLEFLVANSFVKELFDLNEIPPIQVLAINRNDPTNFEALWNRYSSLEGTVEGLQMLDRVRHRNPYSTIQHSYDFDTNTKPLLDTLAVDPLTMDDLYPVEVQVHITL